MKNSRHVSAIALAALAATGIAAAEGSGSGKTLCAITSTLTCDRSDCVRGPANAVNLPVFVRIDTENKLIETVREGDDRRTSAILNTLTEGNALVLLGGELGQGWSANLDRVSGDFTGTVASSNGVAYVLYGSCLAQ